MGCVIFETLACLEIILPPYLIDGVAGYNILGCRLFSLRSLKDLSHFRVHCLEPEAILIPDTLYVYFFSL